MTRLFPTILIVLDFAAAAVWLYYGNPKQAIYWISAGVLTICVTY